MAAREKKTAQAAESARDDRVLALDRALADLDKQFGRGTVMKLGGKTSMQVDSVPTGCLELDLALGVGGIPRGRIVEVFGPESSGKTPVALHVVAEVQKKGGIAAFIDAEHALDPAYARRLGVNIDDLYVSQPNLSRAIKELEASLGVTIFDRSAKGMVLTPDGEVFVRYARSILRQVDAIEEVFSKGTTEKKKFSISVPRASYVTDAFAEFSKLLDKDTPVEIFYKETNSMRSMKNILQDEYKLCIIRYAEGYDKYYKSTFDEKGLTYELITEFQYVLLMSKNSTLAEKEDITFDDLRDRIEIAHADPYVPSLPLSEVKKEELPDNSQRRIFVFERASQFELLSRNPDTFMWVSPIPQELLDRYGLIQRVCPENTRKYKDVLVHRKDYELTELDNMFIEQLVKAKRKTFG